MGYELHQVPVAATTPEPKKVIKVLQSGLVTQEKLSPAQLQMAWAMATKWLMHDLCKLQKNPLPTVNAAPLENYLFEWHGNLLTTSESIFQQIHLPL